jgi:Flp pilus assembly protein CpaB
MAFTIATSEQFNSLQATVTDLAGRVVQSQMVSNSSSFNINLEGESGVYLLQLIGDDERAVLRMVKE